MKFAHIAVIPAVLLLSACGEDYLQRDPGVDQTKEDVFADPMLASRFADRSYTFTVNDYGRLGAGGQPFRGTISEFTDEAVSGSLDVAIVAMNKGDWMNPINATDVTATTANSRSVPPYIRTYQGIRQVNVTLEQFDKVPWEKEPRLNKDLIKAQQLFLRAFFHFELAKRYGGVILADKAVYLDATGTNPDLNVPRSTFEETVAFIKKDLDEAEQLFMGVTEFQTPEGELVYTTATGWNPNEAVGDISGNNGRADLGTVRALRARLLLLAASPLHNPANDPGKWQKAADAAMDVIRMNKYSLHPDYRRLLEVPTSREYIMAYIRGPRAFADNNFFGQYVISPGSGGTAGVLNPTQNHVDLYEMKSGRRITDPRSAYNPANPYANRDDRLAHNVLYNTHPWPDRTGGMQIWYTPPAAAGGQTTYGIDAGASPARFTSTGYYCRKMWPEELKSSTPNAGALLNYVFFRYGEVLLNYAEAVNETGNFAAAVPYLDQIRARVGMPPVAVTFANRGMALSQNNMRELIHNERAVELAFEDMRWWDILRWKKGKEIVAQPIYRMDVKKTGNTFTYTPTLMGQGYQRVFEDHMHLYPIPRSEMVKGNQVQQNPGWPVF